MKLSLTFFAVFFATALLAQTRLYVHPDAKNYVKNTKTIAILPLEVQVKLRPKELENFTPEEVTELSKNESLDIQKSMYSWFLKRQKGRSLLKVQNPNRTNALLKKAGIDIHNYSEMLPSEIGAVLDVETIVMGRFETNKPMSGVLAAGLAVLGGIGFGRTNSAIMNMDFMSTTDEELVVNYYKQVSGSLGSNSEDLINVLMRKVSRRIPYTK